MDSVGRLTDDSSTGVSWLRNTTSGPTLGSIANTTTTTPALESNMTVGTGKFILTRRQHNKVLTSHRSRLAVRTLPDAQFGGSVVAQPHRLKQSQHSYLISLLPVYTLLINFAMVISGYAT